MLVIFKKIDELTLISTAEGVSVESVLSQIPEETSWVVVDGELPSAPRDTWVVNWDTGVITVDPSWTPPPQPAYSLAWADLITSALYQRALELAFVSLPVNTALTTFGFAFQAHSDLPHEVWAGALSASAGHLATAINTTDTPLTDEERSWVDLWNVAHNLGLTINWEAL